MSRYQISNSAAAETIDQEAIVIDLKSGAYYCLLGWTAWAWEALCAGAEVSELESIFGNVGGASEFVDALTGAGLIVERSDLAPDVIPLQPHGEPTPLEFERFDDMADMIQLDPVHDVGRNEGWPRPAET